MILIIEIVVKKDETKNNINIIIEEINRNMSRTLQCGLWCCSFFTVVVIMICHCHIIATVFIFFWLVLPLRSFLVVVVVDVVVAFVLHRYVDNMKLKIVGPLFFIKDFDVFDARLQIRSHFVMLSFTGCLLS